MLEQPGAHWCLVQVQAQSPQAELLTERLQQVARQPEVFEQVAPAQMAQLAVMAPSGR